MYATLSSILTYFTFFNEVVPKAFLLLLVYAYVVCYINDRHAFTSCNLERIIISASNIHLPLIQEEHLSVTGIRMCT